MLKVVQDAEASNEATGSLLDEIVRDGARAMLAAALQAEVAAYVEAFADQLDQDGRRLVVRNGFHDPREVMTAAGAIPVRAPRVNDKRVDEVSGTRRRFASAILPAWARKSPKVAEVLPLLYLHGLSSGDFGPALEQFLGSSAGLSAATITRLTKDWQDEATAFNKRSLAANVRASSCHCAVRRVTVAADRPAADPKKPEEALQRGVKSPKALKNRAGGSGWTGRGGTAAAAPQRPAGTCAPRPAGSPKHTAPGPRSPDRHACR